MLPKYRMLLEYDLSILVFSGDVDAIVPVSSNPISCNPYFVFPELLKIPHPRAQCLQTIAYACSASN